MWRALANWYRSPDQPYVRPWGLAAPIAVLIVCLPLLRPLRHPDPTAISDNEMARLATIQSIVERKSLALDESTLPTAEQLTRIAPVSDAEQKHYSKQPPVLAAMLAGPYWVLRKFGLTFENNLALTSYILTLIGATLPVALAAGLIYRMGRLFELLRPWRTLLAFGAVFGSGLVAYATVLNAHAPAAALILASCGGLFHAGAARNRGHSHAWLVLAGLAASFAAVIDFGAFAFLFLLVFVILAMSWPMASKVGGVAWYVLGALPALFLHASLSTSITGDWRPGFLHPEMQPMAALTTQEVYEMEDEEEESSWMDAALMRFADGVLGPRGLLSHFPIILFGLGGMGAVLHRNWPAPTKALAVVTLAGGIVIVLVYVTMNADWNQPMFSVRWFIPFLPLTVFWGGAWLRKQHHPVMWSAAGAVLAFSVVTTLLGATAPFIHARDGEYTAYAAARQLLSSGHAHPVDRDAIGAERSEKPAIFIASGGHRR